MITLSSDFGSPYPAAMKGVILSRSDARLIDVSHDLPRHDVRQAAFWLTQTLPYFPPATHLVVVDPGVGTDRDLLAVETDDHVLVGPDNGVLVPVAEALSEQPTYFDVDHDPPESSTFHGRDVFAPLAAEIHDSERRLLEEDDRFARTASYEDLQIPEPIVKRDRAEGIVVAVDDFGNAITTIPGHVLGGHFGEQIEVNGTSVPIVETYAVLEEGRALVTVGSHGNVELAVNRGRGDVEFGVEPGDVIGIQI